MKSVIIIHADGRHIDLAGTVDPDTYAELENTRSPHHRPVLRCGGCNGGVYLQHGRVRKDELFGYHHNAGTCTETLVVRKSVMSDEHKREAEYHARAAERAGHVADFEVVTAGHTRVDVVIDGRVGFEIQRSALGKAAAVDRTARSVRAGLGMVAWFTDRSTSPPWTGHVPGYRTIVPVSVWQVLPLPGTVTAAGLQTVEAVRCGTRGPCPHRHRSCNLFIAWVEAWAGLHVDDVVTGLAENQIRPVRVSKNVQLMSTDSIALYEELTGIRLGYDPGAFKAALPPSGRVECALPPRPLPPGAPTPADALFKAELRDAGPESPPHVQPAAVQAEATRLCIRCGQRPRSPHAFALCDQCDHATDEIVARRRP
jgi:hypothetical protein